MGNQIFPRALLYLCAEGTWIHEWVGQLSPHRYAKVGYIRILQQYNKDYGSMKRAFSHSPLPLFLRRSSDKILPPLHSIPFPRWYFSWASKSLSNKDLLPPPQVLLPGEEKGVGKWILRAGWDRGFFMIMKLRCMNAVSISKIKKCFGKVQ